MSAPIPIRSNSASKGSLYDLLQFPPSPPTFVMERHACAFPSWPNRPSLSCPAPAGNGKEASDYFSELDFLGGQHQSRVQQLRPQQQLPRLRRPSNYLELEFEDDSDVEDDNESACTDSNDSTPCGSQQDHHPGAPVKSTNSVPNARHSALSNQLRKYKNSAPKDLRRKIRFTSAVCDD